MGIRDTSVLLYRHTDTGAPSINGLAGSWIPVLDACLVDGYNSIIPDSLVVAGGIATLTRGAGHNFTDPGVLYGIDAGQVIEVAGVAGALSGLNRRWRATVTSPNRPHLGVRSSGRDRDRDDHRQETIARLHQGLQRDEQSRLSLQRHPGEPGRPPGGGHHRKLRPDQGIRARNEHRRRGRTIPDRRNGLGRTLLAEIPNRRLHSQGLVAHRRRPRVLHQEPEHNDHGIRKQRLHRDPFRPAGRPILHPADRRTLSHHGPDGSPLMIGPVGMGTSWPGPTPSFSQPSRPANTPLASPPAGPATPGSRPCPPPRGTSTSSRPSTCGSRTQFAGASSQDATPRSTTGSRLRTTPSSTCRKT